ncbi:type VII secretion protein EccB [Actinoallomurus bryophytorum]|uniref:Type VII secretion protein EccB n=1 Tax=Actinoallomurus bryophytorum TaxID=1490222 RepID=A0A543CGY7_9ACTN|nr:type VII secretion protein EccB [Actinoallomurus bryophytorum]TQL96338.1 type VII secretion protein EccB [Actinoallomurus bryophytorum]
MQTRRDLYQAHRLMMQRIGMALLAGEPDLPEPPTRRLVVSVFAGLMVGILVVAGFGVWGLLSPGGASGLDAPGTLIIEKETGTKYVYSQQDKKLYPVANYASARLILNTDNVTRKLVSQSSLAKFTRGRPVGILGAPESLPDAAHQVIGPWSVCVHSADNGTGGTHSYASLVVGSPVGGGSLGDGHAVVVHGAGDAWVVWRNQRMKLPAAEVRPLSGTDHPTEVSTTWLNAVPEGPDFSPPLVPNRGDEVTGPDGTKATVGTFYISHTVGGTDRWYVLLRDGIAPIKQTEGVLLQNDPDSRLAYKGQPVPVDINPAVAAAAPQSTSKVSKDGLPDQMPKIDPYDAATPLCVVYANTATGSQDARVFLGGTVPTPTADPSTSGGSSAGVVDQVVLPSGDGALLGLLTAPDQVNSISSYSILTDQGLRFAVPSADIAGKLGFDVKKVAPVPGNLLHLIPEGPALDPKQAMQALSFPRSTG